MKERPVPIPGGSRIARHGLCPVALVGLMLASWALFRRAATGNVQLGETAWRVATGVAARPAGPFLATAVVALAGTFFVPITLLEATVLAVFGPWPGIAVAWVGAVLSATASHAAGARWGTGMMGWLPEKLARNLQGLLRGRPFWSVVLMRLLPVGNFGLLNVLAGAVEIPRRWFLLGNVVGIAPGLLGLGVVVSRALVALRHPSVANAILATAVALAATALTVKLRRAAHRSNSQAAETALGGGGQKRNRVYFEAIFPIERPSREPRHPWPALPRLGISAATVRTLSQEEDDQDFWRPVIPRFRGCRFPPDGGGDNDE